MNQYCKNHPDKKALSLCHSCGEYFCPDCLNEGLEYYYCKKDECVEALNKELLRKENVKVKNKSLSKESKFIKRVGIIFIFLSTIGFIDSVIRLKNNIGIYLIPNGIDDGLHFFAFLAKYGWLSLIISLFITGFSLFASVKIYSIKNRQLFLYALVSNIFLIILYNVYIYAYFDFVLQTSLAVLGYEGYKNFWSLEKYLAGIISILFIIIFIFLIKKFSSQKIKEEFGKNL